MCKFVHIFCTNENPSGSCQPFSNSIHIYDETMQPTDVRLHIGLPEVTPQITAGIYAIACIRMFVQIVLHKLKYG